MKHFATRIFVGMAMATVATLVLAKCTIIPSFMVPVSGPPMATPGGTIYYRVGVSPTPTTNQVVNITTNDPDSFSSLPSTVTVLAGHSTVDFSATFSQNPSTYVTTYAACNGTSTDCTVNSQDFGDSGDTDPVKK